MQWPFGHGLSYTRFEYSGLKISGDAGTDVEVSFDVKNTGGMDGAEVVMIFTFDEFRATTPEYKRLRHFEKIFLNSNETKSVSVTLTQEELSFVGLHDDAHYITDPFKPFWIGLGPSVDCRSQPDDALCVKVEASSTSEKPVDPSCLAACDIWTELKCAKVVGMSHERCIEMCSQSEEHPVTYSGVGSKGWGWNYVYCLESVAWGMHQSRDLQCDKLTTFCRDIFHTQGLNDFASGKYSQSSTDYATSETSTFVALLAGIISSVIIFLSVKGKFRPPGTVDTADNIQFTNIVNTDDEDNPIS